MHFRTQTNAKIQIEDDRILDFRLHRCTGPTGSPPSSLLGPHTCTLRRICITSSADRSALIVWPSPFLGRLIRVRPPRSESRGVLSCLPGCIFCPAPLHKLAAYEVSVFGPYEVHLSTFVSSMSISFVHCRARAAVRPGSIPP